MAREGSITDTVLKYLNGIDGCIAEKVAGNSSQKYRPDINGCWRGKSFRIEMKSPDHGYQASFGQRMSLKRWRRCGAVCFTADSLKYVKSRINNDVCE